MMEHVFSLISLSLILQAPAAIMVPGLLIIALFLIAALRSLFSLRIIRAFTSLVMAYVVALFLSQAGQAIGHYLEIQRMTDETSSISFPLSMAIMAVA